MIHLNAGRVGEGLQWADIGIGRMPSEPVAQFSIGYTRYLDPGGNTQGPLPAFAADPTNLVSLYHGMLRTRAFDAKAVALQRTGRLGTFASSLGQEAVGVGAASAMTADDVLLPSFREHGAQLWRGVTPLELLLYWGGTPLPRRCRGEHALACGADRSPAPLSHDAGRVEPRSGGSRVGARGGGDRPGGGCAPPASMARLRMVPSTRLPLPVTAATLNQRRRRWAPNHPAALDRGGRGDGKRAPTD